jgi:glucose/arabinose dehydrogenase
MNRKACFFLLFFLTMLLAVSACGGGDDDPFGVESESVTPASSPGALAFAPDGRLFYAEHWSGSIRVITADGQLLPEPFATVFNIASGVGWGLTGLALDPQFDTNHYVYAHYTEVAESGPPPVGRHVVIRYTDAGNTGTDPKVVVDDLPEFDTGETINAGGSIHFGPDGFLYISLGDHDLPNEKGPQGNELPQDLGVPHGKMLRVDKKDGTAPPDNLFVAESEDDPRIFAYGFRNGFDFAFHPESGRIYGSDNAGPTCEELNIVESGADYGWPRPPEDRTDCSSVAGAKAIKFFARDGLNPEDWTSTVGVAGIEFVSGDVYPLLGDSLLVCETSTRLMRRLELGGAKFDQVVGDDVVARDCQLDIAVSPDGIIYYSTDVEIRRLLPTELSE